MSKYFKEVIEYMKNWFYCCSRRSSNAFDWKPLVNTVFSKSKLIVIICSFICGDLSMMKSKIYSRLVDGMSIFKIFYSVCIMYFSLVYILLEEILTSSIHRCTDFQLMEPRVKYIYLLLIYFSSPDLKYASSYFEGSWADMWNCLV